MYVLKRFFYLFIAFSVIHGSTASSHAMNITVEDYDNETHPVTHPSPLCHEPHIDHTWDGWQSATVASIATSCLTLIASDLLECKNSKTWKYFIKPCLWTPCLEPCLWTPCLEPCWNGCLKCCTPCPKEFKRENGDCDCCKPCRAIGCLFVECCVDCCKSCPKATWKRLRRAEAGDKKGEVNTTTDEIIQ